MLRVNSDTITAEKNINTQKLLCLVNLTNVCLLSSKKLNERKEEKATAKGLRKEKIIRDSSKTGSLIPENIVEENEEADKVAELSDMLLTRQIYLEKVFGERLVEDFQKMEDNDKSISTWLRKVFDTLSEYFKTGKGTVYCTDSETILKKNITLEKVPKSDIEYYTQAWVPVFRKSEVTKNEGNLFVQLDQDIFTALILFLCSLMSYKFKITGKLIIL